MVDIYLIRHGHVDYAPPNPITAHNPLSPLGHQMAERLAERCDELELQLLVASPLRRTQETAAPILARFPDLPHLDMPEFAELNAADLADYPKEQPQEDMNTWKDEHWAFGNERLWERAIAGWQKLLAMTSDRQVERVGLVSHGGTLNVIVRHVLGQETVRLRSAWIQMDYASISCVRYVDSGTFIVWTNDARHIEPIAPVREIAW